MLVIRDAQLSVMAQRTVDRFTADLMSHLREHHQQWCALLGDERNLQAFVRRGMTRARASGIEYPGAIAVFLELLLQFGEDFERSPVREFARNVLAHQTLPGEIKVSAIRDRHDEQMQGRVLVPF